MRIQGTLTLASRLDPGRGRFADARRNSGSSRLILAIRPIRPAGVAIFDLMDWFESETFWNDLYPYMFPPERFAVADEQVDQVLALTKYTGGAALDLCCGPGRHAIALAQRRFAVTGVDRTASLLDRAREHAAIHVQLNRKS